MCPQLTQLIPHKNRIINLTHLDFLIFLSDLQTFSDKNNNEPFPFITYKRASRLFVLFQYTYILRSLPILVPLIHTAVTGSVYTTVAIAIERAATFIPSINKVAANGLTKTSSFVFSLGPLYSLGTPLSKL